MEKVVSCGVIIFNFNKDKLEYLLVKHPNYWGFVRGKMEPNETEQLTAFREALEESGLKDLVFLQGFRKSVEYQFRRDGKLIKKKDIYFLARTRSWNVHLSHEHQDIKWCSYKEALSLIRIKALREVLKKANEFISKC